MSLASLLSPNNYNINASSVSIANKAINPTGNTNTIWSNNAFSPPHLMYGSTDLFTPGPAPVGEKGDKGDIGMKGDQGIQGIKGEDGSAASKGEKGDSGTNGDKGDLGEKGSQGDQGIKGETGTQGIKGDTGTNGTNGDKGDTGTNGTNGEKGDKGDLGSKGDEGSFIATSWTPTLSNIYVSPYTSLSTGTAYYTQLGDVVTASAVYNVTITPDSVGNSTVAFTTSVPVTPITSFDIKQGIFVITGSIVRNVSVGSMKFYIQPNDINYFTLNIYGNTNAIEYGTPGNTYYINVMMQYTVL